jgi:hypothetical protein
MITRTHSIVALLLGMVAVVMLVSCSAVNDEPVTTGEEYQIEFTVGSDEETSRSEAVYTKGEDMENYIRDMRAYIFVDGKYFEDISIEGFAQTGYDVEKYVVSGTIAKVPTKNFTVLVLANMDSNGGVTNYYPSMNSGTTFAGVVSWNCYFKYHDTTIDRDRRYDAYKPSEIVPIPMYGVKQYTLSQLSFDKNIATDMGQVDILRAYAKVRLTCNKTLQNVILTRCKVGGLGCPLGMYENTAYPVKGNLNVPNTVNYYRNTATVNDLPFDVIDDGDYQLYMPEYDNLSNSANRTEMSFRYNGIDYRVEFKDYETGEYFNILRNHFYQFDVTITDYPTIEINYSVSSWRQRSTYNIKFD